MSAILSWLQCADSQLINYMSEFAVNRLSAVGQASHYSDVIINAMASQLSGVSIVYSTVWSRADQRKHQSSASLAFVRGIHRWPVNSPHKRSVTWKMFLAWRHQAIIWNSVDLSSVRSSDIHLREFSKEKHQPSITKFLLAWKLLKINTQDFI